MSSIVVDERGNSLYYVDTGAPGQAGSEKAYTTLIVVHGNAFHGATFKRILPLSSKHNLRLVVVNRRDYPGSSPYTNEELDNIRNGDPSAHMNFAKNRAREFASFIRNFVEQNKIPRAAEDGKSGGVVLMAWSAGGYYALQILAFADAIDSETRAAIEPYFRSLIMFDASQWTIGSPFFNHGFNVTLRDTSLTLEERGRRFVSFVDAYYTHPNLKSRNVEDLQRIADPEARPGSIPAMSHETLAELTCYEAVHSEVVIRSAEPEVYQSFARRALFEPSVLACFPRCRVDIVWCENTTWEAVCTVWTLEKLIENADERGIEHRRLTTFMIPGPGANHFVHWDDPEKAMAYFASVLSS